FPRGVHLAPWTASDGKGRAFVAISTEHRLVAQSDAKTGEEEAHVRQLLEAALDIADPLEETSDVRA
ncbi:MAG: hypothetical protein ACT4P6_09405, partial [Gemmatimonadaceae bacterium]